ncbi:hypothetical protein ACFPC0_11065 [Streptomyces andamanensis]|uniref:Zinc-ribbon domain-containing protein n=1 Tax=Streptomyces andamanensis TaxID=1565035 RepID=A0ABV8TCR2_9ACTN
MLSLKCHRRGCQSTFEAPWKLPLKANEAAVMADAGWGAWGQNWYCPSHMGTGPLVDWKGAAPSQDSPPSRAEWEDTVRELLATLGWELVEGEIPVRNDGRLRLRCLGCRQRRSLRLRDLRAGVSCSHQPVPQGPVPPEELEALLTVGGWELVGRPSSLPSAVVKLQCLKCRHPRSATLLELRQGLTCLHPNRPPRLVGAAAAAEELKQWGYEPIDPYPGKAMEAWKVRCTTCLQQRTVRLAQLRSRNLPCTHFRVAKLTHEEAAEEVRAAGYEPMEPYPGRTAQMWTLKCLTCKRDCRTHLSWIRRGKVCQHRYAKRNRSPQRGP